MLIYIASDHGGFEFKGLYSEYLTSLGHEVRDFGPIELSPSDDYPKFVVPTMQAMQENPEAKGILICRNGVGVSILANKFKGIRCALSWTSKHIKTAREDDDVNVLAIPADYIDGENAKLLIDTFLNTPFSQEERHIRRLKEVEDIEK